MYLQQNKKKLSLTYSVITSVTIHLLVRIIRYLWKQ